MSRRTQIHTELREANTFNTAQVTMLGDTLFWPLPIVMSYLVDRQGSECTGQAPWSWVGYALYALTQEKAGRHPRLLSRSLAG